ncbi:hypothetical protein PoB_007554800 [Plakobranchus ocellatus]|uniref:Uncharacterized protein n=1 Tax=Plakobranchus ocellatus TaxID=259542 RepID=A0AAV4DY78_9GAST|nr:hypothetical protein PoB_007554800 [Plakobranchus ocellatus]
MYLPQIPHPTCFLPLDDAPPLPSHRHVIYPADAHSWSLMGSLRRSLSLGKLSKKKARNSKGDSDRATSADVSSLVTHSIGGTEAEGGKSIAGGDDYTPIGSAQPSPALSRRVDPGSPALTRVQKDSSAFEGGNSMSLPRDQRLHDVQAV